MFQTFLLDHAVIREKFRRLKERWFPSLKFEYSAIEEEIVSTPGWPPVGGNPITAIYREDTSFTDMYPQETDKMLPGNTDSNNSSAYCSTQSVGITPRTSMSENPYTSTSTMASVSKSSVSDVGEGRKFASGTISESAEMENLSTDVRMQVEMEGMDKSENTHLFEADEPTR